MLIADAGLHVSVLVAEIRQIRQGFVQIVTHIKGPNQYDVKGYGVYILPLNQERVGH